MKRRTAAVVGLVLVVISSVALNWHRAFAPVAAQEPLIQVKGESPAPPQQKTTAENLWLSDDRPYPALFVDDVISLLTTAIEELIEKKAAKSSDDLRKNLDRTEFATTLPQPFVKQVSTSELYRRTIDSVFLVAGLTKPTANDTAWKTAFSTAFVVQADGILSTSAHVFDHNDHDDAVIVMDVRGKTYPIIELLAVNRKADTCLFRIDAKGLQPLPLGKEVPPGTPIRVLGHPGDSFYFFSAGHLANYERDEEGRSWLNITADFGQGSSGGPVMDEAGNVVGQVSRTYTLYAGGESSQRRRRPRVTRAMNAVEPAEEAKKDAPAEELESRKKSDPQMVFKACTPVSAIRALVK